MNKLNIIFLSVVFAILLGSVSCEASSTARGLEGTAWFTQGNGGYREEIVLNEDLTFLWTQSVDSNKVDSVTGTYETFYSVVGGFYYVNLRLIVPQPEPEIGVFTYTYRVYMTPYDDVMKSIILEGKTESTIYYFIPPVPEEAPVPEGESGETEPEEG